MGRRSVAADPVVDTLLQDLVEGRSYMTGVLRTCALLLASGRGGWGVDFLASIGEAHPMRDLMVKLPALYGHFVVPTHETKLRMRVKPGSPIIDLVRTRCILPYDVLSCVGQAEACVRQRFLGTGGWGAVASYWREIKKNGVPHHVVDDPHPKPNRTLPMYWHADDVELYTNQSCSVWSWSVATNDCNDPAIRQQPFLVLDSKLVCRETVDDIVKLIEHSDLATGSGRHPYSDENLDPWPAHSRKALRAGNALVPDENGAPTIFSAFSAWLGDMKERVQQHGFRRNYMANMMCERCAATRWGDGGGYDFREGARWLACQAETNFRSPWARVRSFSMGRILYDLLHLLWLGVVKDLLGSELLLATRDRWPELSLSDALGHLQEELSMRRKLSSRSLSLKPLRASSVGGGGDKDYPVLHSAVKGSACKELFMAYSDWLAADFDPQAASERDHLRATCVCSLRTAQLMFLRKKIT